MELGLTGSRLARLLRLRIGTITQRGDRPGITALTRAHRPSARLRCTAAVTGLMIRGNPQPAPGPIAATRPLHAAVESESV